MRLSKSVLLTFIIASGCLGCNESSTLFELVPSSKSGIKFNNVVTENDSINPLDMEYIYNGGGVAIGDFDKDGKPDVYFTASQTENRLYLNRGNFKFEDVTKSAQVEGQGRWCNGAAIVDINNDGLDDIYVSASIKNNPEERTNLLYVNQGNNAAGIPVFKEMAKQYNLADTGFSVQAAFLDYDRDGDLDMYLATTGLAQRNSSRFDGNTGYQRDKLSDKLYRNEGSDSLGHPFFRDVSKQAGVADHGYALGIGVADVNNDGWKDIYVSNDFNSSDVLYINNQDGTFSDQTRTSFKHTSMNAMGNDIADINNDGLEDIVAVDMNPEDNFRKKKNMSGGNYYVYQSMLRGDYVLQYVRNTLQLNNGNAVFDTSNKLVPSFSDISFYAGVAETDWSWNPSLADFDNDGFKDLIVTNGYPKDVTDHDFAAFRDQSSEIASKEYLLGEIPAIKIPNYAYRNTGDLRFQNVSASWGLSTPCFSNGAAYVDLDGDGDLDYIINNINDEAFVYRNTLTRTDTTNFIDIKFEGSKQNSRGIGAIARLHHNGYVQVFDNTPYRGYLSCVNTGLHFGVGRSTAIDSLVVVWPDGRQQVLVDVKSNQTLVVKYADAGPAQQQPTDSTTLFTDITSASGVDYTHQEFDYIDFDRQKLLPRRFSQFGPSIAVGDIDGNGLDDIFLGASGGNDAYLLFQQTNGKFAQKELPSPTGKDVRKPEMLGALFFDCESDGDLDLYVASGSNEFAPNSKNYQDRLYINDKGGNLRYDSTALPIDFTSKSCVQAADFDKDGDLDLFVGGRIYPERYPEPVSSFIYRNDSKIGQPKFTDISNEVAPFLNKIGLVCDAVWTDFDNDGWIDLVVAGEWMPLRFFKNKRGRFEDVTLASGIENKKGWWSSIITGDFDNDGDIDFIAGNTGLNSFFKASPTEPVSIYANDFNKDNFYDAVPSIYLPDEKGVKKEYPVHVRDEMVQQIVGIRKKFNKYTDYARATIYDILPDTANALKLQANYLASSLIENKGGGKFEIRALPTAAQMAPLYGLVAQDINEDGNLDLLISGNDYGNEIVNGHYDALNGLVLLGDGQNNFVPQSIEKSGLFIPGDGKGLAQLLIGDKYALAATQNKGPLKLFSLAKNFRAVRFNNDDVKAIIHLSNGKIRLHEIHHGGSFPSQSARIILINNSVKSVEVIDRSGNKRSITP